VIRSIKPQVMERNAPLPIPARKPWTGLSISIAMHALLVLFVLLTIRNPSEKNPASTVSTQPIAPVNMVYLPQPRRARPLPQPAPPKRPAPDAIHDDHDRRALATDPDQDLPPAMEQTKPETPNPEPPKTQPPPENSFASTPPVPRTETMEDEAKRIFGRPLLRRQQDNFNQIGIRMGDLASRNEPERTTCIPKPRDPTAPIEMATLVGRVYTPGHRPLGGAFLQIIGTSYSTFSDGSGLYRLVFDASLVDECRTQYVRVVADGYRGRNLVLGVGPGINDVMLAR
jgi:hypothetical protein